MSKLKCSMEKYTLLVILVLIIGIISFLISCSSIKVYEPIEYSDGDDYLAYTIQNNTVQTSFEYPSIYDIGELSLSLGETGNIVGKAVVFGVPFSEEQPMFFFVTHYDISDSLSDIDTAVNKRLSWVKEQVKLESFTDYSFLGKNKVKVSNIDGVELIYSYFFAVDIPPGHTFSCLERDVYLSYGNMIWEIKMMSDTSLADQANADFEHILQTFKILD